MIRWSKLLSSGAFLTSLVVMMGAMLGGYTTFKEIENRSSSDLVRFEIDQKIAESRQDQLAIIQKKIQDMLSQLTETPVSTTDLNLTLKLKALENRINKLSEDVRIIDVIEKAITENPERAMSIPILRKDVDLIRDSTVQDISAIRSEIDRIYDLGKWFLGLIATMALGVLGLAAGNLIKNKDGEPTQ